MTKRKPQEPLPPRGKQEWECVFCTIKNPNTITICDMCGKSKENKKVRVDDDDDNEGGLKECEQCTFKNKSTFLSCEVCGCLLNDGVNDGENDREVDDDNNEENDASPKDSEESENSGEDSEDEEPYHPGELEFDYESSTWDDWDERCHGPRDTNSHRNEYPDGFRWSCCGEPGDAEGCEERED